MERVRDEEGVIGLVKAWERRIENIASSILFRLDDPELFESSSPGHEPFFEGGGNGCVYTFWPILRSDASNYINSLMVPRGLELYEIRDSGVEQLDYEEEVAARDYTHRP